MVAKKTPVKKSAKTTKPTKAAPRKKAPAKKPAQMQSFRVYNDSTPFSKVQVTRQTLYWIILLTFIVITQLWLLKIQLDIANLTALLSVE